jgi:voltage-gated potassium channel Kch
MADDAAPGMPKPLKMLTFAATQSRFASFFDDENSIAYSPVSSTLLVRQLKRERGFSLRERCFLIFYEPSSSPAATAYAAFNWFCLISSSIVFQLETVRALTDATGAWPWLFLRYAFLSTFTIDIVLRIMCHIPFQEQWRDPFLWIGLITVLPFWGRWLGTDSLRPDTYLLGHERWQLTRILESLAMFRVVLLCRYYKGGVLLGRAAVRSTSQLGVPLFMLLIVATSFSAVLYAAEWDATIDECVRAWVASGIEHSFLASHPNGVTWDCAVCADGKQSDDFACLMCPGFPEGYPHCVGVPFEQIFPSIPEALWFVGVTMTTVGYGDMTPVSWAGRLVCGFIIVSGVLFLAMPLAIVGNTFTGVWESRHVEKFQSLTRQLLTENDEHHDAAGVVHVFSCIDHTGDGVIDSQEFAEFVTGTLNFPLAHVDMANLWKQCARSPRSPARPHPLRGEPLPPERATRLTHGAGAT